LFIGEYREIDNIWKKLVDDIDLQSRDGNGYSEITDHIHIFFSDTIDISSDNNFRSYKKGFKGLKELIVIIQELFTETLKQIPQGDPVSNHLGTTLHAIVVFRR
jgi:hypothetical protein